MKKEFIAVSDRQAALDDARFADDLWTRHWDDRTRPRPEVVRRSAEYRVMRPLLERLARGSFVLDGGCGMGDWTVFLRRSGFGAVGIDVSGRTLARLGREVPGRLLCADIRQTAFRDGVFDLYFSWGTFEHFPDGLAECFHEARRILKPGGFLLTSVPFYNLRHRWRDARRAGEAASRAGELRFYQWRLTREDLEREFDAAGFRLLGVRPIHKWDGLHRAVHHDLRIRSGSWAHGPVVRALSLVVPASWVAHLIVGAGVKR